MVLLSQKIPLLLFTVVGLTMSAASADEPLWKLSAWLKDQKSLALQLLEANISAPGTHPGCVIASPSNEDPNYFFHWIRDAALVMDAYITYGETLHKKKRQEIANRYYEWLDFSRLNQEAPTAAGLGEVRFNVDGSVDLLAWSRPQWDGPALRSLTIEHFLTLAHLKLYPMTEDQLVKMRTIMWTDLDFLATGWGLPNFDVWEEYLGTHFHTLLVVRESLARGSLWAKKWGDTVREQAYREQAKNIEVALLRFWDHQESHLLANLDHLSGADNKNTNLDTAVILAVLQSRRWVGDYSLTDDRVMSTIKALEDLFKRLYPINKDRLAPAIGRYEDDIYYGGHPWYLTTMAMAQYHYQLARYIDAGLPLIVTDLNKRFLKELFIPGKAPVLRAGGEIPDILKKIFVKALKIRGDQYLNTVRTFTPADGHWSEQFDRTTGTPVSAEDLTWSYSNFLLATFHRQFL